MTCLVLSTRRKRRCELDDRPVHQSLCNDPQGHCVITRDKSCVPELGGGPCPDYCSCLHFVIVTLFNWSDFYCSTFVVFFFRVFIVVLCALDSQQKYFKCVILCNNMHVFHNEFCTFSVINCAFLVNCRLLVTMSLIRSAHWLADDRLVGWNELVLRSFNWWKTTNIQSKMTRA